MFYHKQLLLFFALLAASIQARAQTPLSSTGTYSVVPVGAGVLVVGHSSGTITYCTITILSAYSGLVATDTPVGKCTKAGSLSLPVNDWTVVGGSSGAPQFVNTVTGQVMLCATFQVTVSETPSQPVGSAIASCILEGTASQ